MNSLDSRYLRLGDTFAHRFVTHGTYRYTVGIPGGIAPPDHHGAFEILVAAGAGTASTTHYATVSFADGVFSVEPKALHIRHNDVVLWSTASATTPGFAVQCTNKTAQFGSAELPANSMYSHAFGSPGEFAWSSVRDPRLNGTVSVTAHPPCLTEEHRVAYLEKLSKASLVMIDGTKAHPRKIAVTVGQTVFFAVRSGEGVAIVDRTLLAATAGMINPQPLPP